MHGDDRDCARSTAGIRMRLCGAAALAAALAAGPLFSACGGDSPGPADGGDAEDVAPNDAADDGTPPEEADADGDEDAWPERLELDPGQVVELEADGDGMFEAMLAAPGGSERFGILLYSARWATGQVGYDVAVTGAAAMVAGEGEAKAGGRPPWDRRHALVDLGRAAAALRDGSASLVRRDPMPPPIVGERRPFLIARDVSVETIDAECLWVGDDLALWMDRTTAGGGDIAPAVRDDVGARFEGTVMPRHRLYFGEESDLNSDGVVSVLFSPIVSDTATAYFSPCDLFDAAALPFGCDYSNEQEMIYMTPPDMLGPPMNSARAIVATMAHEVQHLVYFHRKVIRNSLDAGGENAYLVEGWASLGEDVSGYGLGTFFVAREGLTRSDDFGAIEVLRSGAGYNPSRDGMLRGAAYLFVRYAFDRMGGDAIATDGTISDLGGIAWSRTAVDSPHQGSRNFENTVGVAIDDLVFDWFTALMMSGRSGSDGRPLPVEPRFSYGPRVQDPVTTFHRGFDPYGSQFGMTLTGPATTTLARMDRTIPATGSEIILVDADGSGREMTVRLTGDDLASLRVRVARLR